MSFQCRNVTVLDGGEVLANPILILIPPADGLQRRDGLLVKPFADAFRRDAGDNGIGRHILRHHGTAADDRAVSNGHARENDRIV